MDVKVKCRYEKCGKIFHFDPDVGNQVLFRGTSLFKNKRAESAEEDYVVTCPHCKTAKKIRIAKGDNDDQEY